MKRYLSFMMGMLLIGSFFVANKQIVREVPIFLASEFRLLAGASCLYLLGLLSPGVSMRIERGDVKLIVVQVFFGIFLFSIFSLNGLRQTSAVNSGIIMGMTPAAILSLGLFVKRERISVYALASCAMACAGAAVLQFARSGEGDGVASAQGDLLIFLAMLGEAVFITAGRFVKGAVHPLAMSAFMTCLGALMFLPLAMVQALGFQWGAVSHATWLWVLYAGVGITAIGVFLMNYGAAGIPMATTASLSSLMPASTCVLALVFLQESFGPGQLLGLALIVVSALLAVVQRRRTAPAAPP